MRYKTSFSDNAYNYTAALFVLSIVLSIFGCLMIFSCIAHLGNSNFLLKQIVAIILGIFLCVLTTKIDLIIFKKVTYPLMIFNLILLFLVFYFPAKNGAHRWIQIPFFGNFQPAELTKVVLVLFMARFLDLHRSKIIKYKKELWILLAFIFVFCILIMFQPDIGTPLLIMSVLLIILFISSMKKDFFLKILFISFLLIFFGFLLKPYRIERLKAMINPWKYQSKVGYQLIQSYLSLARGHFSGCGLGNGIFKEYYLPEAHTDFIFCMIGEELGFIGATLLVLIYSIMCFLGISVAYKLSSSKNLYGGIIVLGLTFNIVLQAYISISMTLGLLPTKGMGLPFVSYGGSSMIINFLSIGIILNMAQRIK